MRCLLVVGIAVTILLLNLPPTSPLSSPTSTSPRLAALSRLFPAFDAATSLLPAPSFTAKKKFTLRLRVAQERAAVQRYTREIAALEKRLGGKDEGSVEARSIGQRQAELRSSAGRAEARILRLKSKQRSLGMPTRRGPLGSSARLLETFFAREQVSASVLASLLASASDPWGLVRSDAMSLARITSRPDLLAGYARLPDAPLLLPHAAAIAARISLLEAHAPGLLLAVEGHLDVVEPHLDKILSNLDKIEPHLPFVLDNLPVLAPHCGILLKHMDALLLFADSDAYLPSLLPYVPTFAPLLDDLACHLVLLRPHMRVVLPHLEAIAPSAHRFASAPAVSENADVLLYYFSWVLRLPAVGRRVLGAPGMPRIASLLARIMPKWPVRGGCAGVRCNFDGCDLEPSVYAGRVGKRARG